MAVGGCWLYGRLGEYWLGLLRLRNAVASAECGDPDFPADVVSARLNDSLAEVLKIVRPSSSSPPSSSSSAPSSPGGAEEPDVKIAVEVGAAEKGRRRWGCSFQKGAWPEETKSAGSAASTKKGGEAGDVGGDEEENGSGESVQVTSIACTYTRGESKAEGRGDGRGLSKATAWRELGERIVEGKKTETERQRDRETERQRDRETERDRERQRDRETTLPLNLCDCAYV